MMLAKLCFAVSVRGCRLAWSRLVDLGSIDPGSNPGSPTSLQVQNHRDLDHSGRETGRDSDYLRFEPFYHAQRVQIPALHHDNLGLHVCRISWFVS
jgi:hypothetical protein